MRRRHYPGNDGYDSDEPFSSESVTFHSTEEPSMIRDVEADDIPDLLCSAVYPPEYYYHIAEEVNNVDFDEQDYSPGTEKLFNVIK